MAASKILFSTLALSKPRRFSKPTRFVRSYCLNNKIAAKRETITSEKCCKYLPNKPSVKPIPQFDASISKCHYPHPAPSKRRICRMSKHYVSPLEGNKEGEKYATIPKHKAIEKIKNLLSQL